VHPQGLFPGYQTLAAVLLLRCYFHLPAVSFLLLDTIGQTRVTHSTAVM
jgi:hypothetical protein